MTTIRAFVKITKGQTIKGHSQSPKIFIVLQGHWPAVHIFQKYITLGYVQDQRPLCTVYMTNFTSRCRINIVSLVFCWPHFKYG